MCELRKLHQAGPGRLNRGRAAAGQALPGGRSRQGGVRWPVGSGSGEGRAGRRCQRWVSPGEVCSGTAGGSEAALCAVTGSANNSCGAIFLFGQRGKGHCSQIGLFNNTCMHS